MANTKAIVVPDIGSTEDVDVIEIMVAPGDKINKDDSIITLESDKATMEVPASEGGIVEAVLVKVGDKISTGSEILTIKSESGVAEKVAVEEAPVVATKAASSEVDVTIPDLGTSSEVDVIEVLVAVGDVVEKEQAVLTLEGEKATMDVPVSHAGTIQSLAVKVGDKVTTGSPLLTLLVEGEATPQAQTETKPTPPPAPVKPPQPAAPAPVVKSNGAVYAGPAVRRLAREFGVDLNQVVGTGRKQRLLAQDIKNYVKSQLSAPSGSGLQVSQARAVDFSKFGEIETQPLNKIKKLTGQHVHRSWVTVPHVTQFDEADITEMDAFRKENKKQAEAQGAKLTPLIFIMKAVVAALKDFPTVNSSLDASAENLIVKKYFNIGVAVDTPNGLVVPVIRDVDKKGFIEIAKELAEVSQRAREKGLMPKDMEGSCFTISSLGGIGGTAFTPIVNTPDVAILGVSKAKMQPVFQNGEFVPRLILPLSLSYDHRVIDGALGARFTQSIAMYLQDIRRLLF